MVPAKEMWKRQEKVWRLQILWLYSVTSWFLAKPQLISRRRKLKTREAPNETKNKLMKLFSNWWLWCTYGTGIFDIHWPGDLFTCSWKRNECHWRHWKGKFSLCCVSVKTVFESLENICLYLPLYIWKYYFNITQNQRITQFKEVTRLLRIAYFSKRDTE